MKMPNCIHCKLIKRIYMRANSTEEVTSIKDGILTILRNTYATC